MAKVESRTYTSGEICERFGIAKNTLFRWEREGKIPAAERDWRNYRRYSENHVRAIEALMEGELAHVTKRIHQCLRDEENPREALEELKTLQQLASALKFTKSGKEIGLDELAECEALASETILELLQEAQREDSRSYRFFRIIDLIHSKTEPVGISNGS